jgi:nucleotide-binding universal stress UspA family protein
MNWAVGASYERKGARLAVMHEPINRSSSLDTELPELQPVERRATKMSTFSRILFPVDFSARCSQTTCCAGEIARLFGSELTLLHVFGGFDSLELGVASRSTQEDVCKQLIRQRQHELEQFGKGCFEGVRVRRVVKSGNPAECITAYAQEQGMDLIIIPTHGHGRFRRLLAGSVTLKLLHDASCCVWTTAHSEALPSHPPQQIGNIVCAVDLGPDTARFLRATAGIASAFGATVRLVHAVPAPEGKHESSIHEVVESQIIEAAKEKIARLQQEAGTSFEAYVQAGAIPGVLRRAAAIFHADLVMIGRGRLQEHFGRLWSHVGSIIHESPCSVLSV